jgi:hypothetical protein
LATPNQRITIVATATVATAIINGNQFCTHIEREESLPRAHLSKYGAPAGRREP